MLTDEQAKGIVDSFKSEVCDFLGIESSSITVKYTSSNQNNIPVFILDNEDTIVVDKQYLDSCIASKSTTPLRTEIYAKARLIYKRGKNGVCFNKYNPKNLYESKLYASAINTLKGLSLPVLSSNNNKDELEGVKRILSNEFGLNGDFIKIEVEPVNGCDFYRFLLTDNDTKKEVNRYKKETTSTVKGLSDEAKGSINNPFDNINDAVTYLERVERIAYEEDKFIQEIANQKYIYDPERGGFRISWASPFVAHLKNNFPTHSFIINQMLPLDLQNPQDFNFSLKLNLYKRKFLYRGQSDHYSGLPCVPNMYRDKKHNKERSFIDFMIFSQELEVLMRSHPLTQLLEKGVVLLHDTFKIRMHYTGLAQHYYNKSNYLDLTSDIDVMKFFATTDYDSVSDKYSPVKDLSKTGVIYYYELLFPSAFQQHDGYALKTIGKQVFMRSGAQSGFLLEMAQDVDMKKIPEVKAVYFKHDQVISEKIFKDSGEGADYFAEDILEHAWHDRMKGRFSEKKVSMKAVEHNIKFNEGETIASTIKQLNDRGIKVDNYTPEFTEEELDIYYQSIKDGWWEKFCDDIYFQGGDGELYRDELKNIRHQPEYKWAFEKQ